jgi:hypothetical protein
MIDTNDFDGEIERELNRVLRPVDGASIPAWRAPDSGALGKRILGGAGAAIALKVLTGFAVVAFAGVGALAATEAATTGSLNPADWGQQVKQQVAACKAALTDGKHGIGDCVSAFAKQHGDMVSDQHSASSARLNHGNDKNKGNDHNGNNGHGNGNGNGSANSNGKGNGHGKPSDLPAHP